MHVRRPFWPMGRQPADDEVAEVEALHRRHHRDTDLPLLREAYQVAATMHQGQTRDSGEPYIIHPVAVARILAELGLDTPTLAAALLHDTIEDTSYTLTHLRAQFGDTIAQLVDGVTKLDKIYFGDLAEAETLRKMILAARSDIRVLIIKVADRLHNMRTLQFKPGASQTRTATVTRDILIPIADRLGLYTLRRELEDRVLAILEPDTYQRIDTYLRGSEPERQPLVATAKTMLGAALREARIQAKLHDRPRHHYSVYREMVKYPHLGPQHPARLVVVVAGEPVDCYAALGAVHRTWPPVPGRFNDLIANPKHNLYRSLHTTVIGPRRRPMDVLIRTRSMHEIAEIGIVADLAQPSRATSTHPRHLEWLDRLARWQQDAAEPDLFLDSLRGDLAQQEIIVITAEGNAVRLPSGATSVDLAYHVDPIAADRLIGASVNGRLTSLATSLADGDHVELIHGKHHDHLGPSQGWLQSARTPHARLRISQAFASHEQTTLQDSIANGELKIAAALRRHDRALPTDATLTTFVSEYGYPDPDALFLAIQQGKLSADTVATNLVNQVDRWTSAP